MSWFTLKFEQFNIAITNLDIKNDNLVNWMRLYTISSYLERYYICMFIQFCVLNNMFLIFELIREF